MNTPENAWHLDKRVPIALLLALLVQAGGWIWWAASLNHRVTSNTLAITRLETQAELRRVEAQQQAVQLGRIEEQITGLRDDMARLLQAIERTQR